MSVPESELPWYQFSLRSLLLLAVFVAVICSFGSGADWSVLAVIAVGGVAGRIIAGRWFGLIVGVLSAGVYAVIAAIACAGICFFSFDSPATWAQSWQCIAAKIAAIIGALIGGVLGGFTARLRSER